MAIPFIYLAFANSEEKYLANLLSEANGIRQLLLMPKKFEQLDFQITEVTTSDIFIDTISKIGTKINFLHFSGHSGEEGLEFFNGFFSDDRIKDVLSIWKDTKSLEFVFLNGCYTEKLANLFDDIGVKAVLATSNKIPDLDASKLSIKFYEYLAIPDGSYDIERAFRLACSNIDQIPSEELIFHVARFIEGFEEFDNNEFPWNLFYLNEDDKQVKLIRAEKKINPNERELLNQLDDLKQDIELFNDSLMKSNDAPDKERLKNRIEKKRNEYDAKYNEFIKGVDRQYINAALYSLNYNNQFIALEKSPGKNSGKPFALIASGTPDCGLGFWVKRCMSAAQLDTLNGDEYRSDIKKIKIEFDRSSSARINHLSIWKEIREQISESKPESDTSEDILKSIYEYYLSGDSPKHIVFIFNNIHVINDDTELLGIIEEFWFKLYSYLSSTSLTRKVLLFLIDRGRKEDGDFGTIVGRDYQTLFSNQGRDIEEEFGLCLLPNVEPLEDEILSTWYSGQNWLLGRYFKGYTECLPKDSKPFMMPTIRHILIRANLSDEIHRFEQMDTLI